ncbi:hypothetical protein EB001_00815 [bacterium]|nr:hypothetical protein [bacterium]
MRKWWFFIKAFNIVFKMNTVKQEEEEKIEMYVCSLCGSIYLDKHSYLTHYKVDACTAPMYILPSDPLHIKDTL